MHLLWSLVSLFTVVDLAQSLEWDDRAPLRFMRRDVPYANITAPTSNFTSRTTPPSRPADTSTTPSPDCAGFVTYYGSVPPTVYVTVTEGFDVTVTASNVSVTDAPTLITPLPACEATVMPLVGTANPAASFALPTNTTQRTYAPEIATANPNAPALVPPTVPAAATEGGPPVPEATTVVYSSVPYTSTVIVTKKTPVTVVAPSTPPTVVDFQTSSHPPPSIPNNGGGNPQATGGGSNGDGNNAGGLNENNSPAGGSFGPNTVPNTGLNLPPASQGTPTGLPSPHSAGAAPGSSAVAPTTTIGLGNIIASIINSGFATRSPASQISALPITTTIGTVRVIVLPSSVVIGSQTVPIPTSHSTTVEADGATFTVGPSKVVAPSGTVTFPPLHQGHAVTTAAPTGTIVTAIGHLTVTIGPTVAIIAGTTYRIGQNAPATTVTVDGTIISIGSYGVGLPSTTFGAGAITGFPFLVYTVEGLIFSVDESEAVVGGTTYRIGTNAPEVKTTIQSAGVSFGPGGVGLRSTTIAPTAALSPTAENGMKSTSVATPSATPSLGQSSGASSPIPRPFSELFGRYLMAISLGWLVL